MTVSTESRGKVLQILECRFLTSMSKVVLVLVPAKVPIIRNGGNLRPERREGVKPRTGLYGLPPDRQVGT